MRKLNPAFAQFGFSPSVRVGKDQEKAAGSLSHLSKTVLLYWRSLLLGKHISLYLLSPFPSIAPL